MFVYEYVTIDNDNIFGATYVEHRKIIDEYAKKNYRYVGFVPTQIAEHGKYKKIDLIFEKQE